MRYLLFIFCIVAFDVSTKPVIPLDVQYRDYLGQHRVKGVKKSANTFIFNPQSKKVIKLATLDWPPYIGKDICKQGWVMQSAIAVLHHLGYRAEVSFYPWARSMKLVESGKADILFPEYFIGPEAPSDVFNGTRRLDHLVLSEKFGWGPIAFIKRKNYDLSHFTNLKSLVNEHIGVVRGYQNTPEFDRMMDMGSFKIIEALNDLHNVKLLLNHRVNLIIGDPTVIELDIKNSDLPDKDKKTMLAQIEIVDPIVKMNALFFAISKQSKYIDIMPMQLNQAISAFKKQGLFNEMKYSVEQECKGQ